MIPRPKLRWRRTRNEIERDELTAEISQRENDLRAFVSQTDSGRRLDDLKRQHLKALRQQLAQLPPARIKPV